MLNLNKAHVVYMLASLKDVKASLLIALFQVHRLKIYP